MYTPKDPHDIVLVDNYDHLEVGTGLTVMIKKCDNLNGLPDG